jgi:hypothetical protein
MHEVCQFALGDVAAARNGAGRSVRVPLMIWVAVGVAGRAGDLDARVDGVRHGHQHGTEKAAEDAFLKAQKDFEEYSARAAAAKKNPINYTITPSK